MQTIGFNGKPHLVVDRRKFLATAAGLIAAGVLPANVLALVKPYSFTQGSYEITVVSDGALLLPVSLFATDSTPADIAKLLGEMVEGENARIAASPLVLKSATDTILLDTGSGNLFQPTAGKLGESLKAAGFDPAGITRVIFTHAHPDHCWGTIGTDGKPVFPNAPMHMAENEWNFWAAPDLASKMPEGMKPMVTTTQAQFAGMKPTISFFKPGTELVPGMQVLDTPGHTPGHVSFELAGGDGLIITGDTIPNPAVYFAHPDWKFGFDADHETAAKSRKMVLDMAATGKKRMIGYHWAYPGLGYAEAKDGAYVFTPAS